MHNIKNIKNIVLTLLILVGTDAVKSQNQSGAIAISEEDMTPYESAMLDVSSDKKGVLLPRMAYDNMYAIDPPTDGLVVFVTTPTELRGYYYWDSAVDRNSPNPEGDWVKLMLEDDSKEVTAPVGTILMYAGKFEDENGNALFGANGVGVANSHVSGWALCDGQGGRPDLRERFIVGYSGNGNYTMGNTGGSSGDYYSEANLPTHRHFINAGKAQGVVLKHKHELTETDHRHKVVTIKKNKSDASLYRRRDNNDGWQNHDPSVFTSTTEFVNVQVQPNDDKIDFDFPPDFLEETGEGSEKYNNRPRFYVVAYIVKISY